MLVEDKRQKSIQQQYQSPGILDSPTLARVERAMLRYEEGSHRENAHLHRSAITQVIN